MQTRVKRLNAAWPWRRIEYGWVVLFVLLFGAGFGAITPARAALLYGRFGSYEPVLWMLAAASAGAAVVILVGTGGARRGDVITGRLIR